MQFAAGPGQYIIVDTMLERKIPSLKTLSAIGTLISSFVMKGKFDSLEELRTTAAYIEEAGV